MMVLNTYIEVFNALTTKQNDVPHVYTTNLNSESQQRFLWQEKSNIRKCLGGNEKRAFGTRGSVQKDYCRRLKKFYICFMVTSVSPFPNMNIKKLT